MDEIQEVMTEQEANVVPLKKDVLEPKQARLWLNRCRTVNRVHRKKIEEKHSKAKLRYNSEAYGFQKRKGDYTHTQFDFLFKNVEEFNASIYHKNPELDLTARNVNDEAEVWRVENLEQVVNDDINDDRGLKALIRSALVDEGLAGISGIYLDYDNRTRNTGEFEVEQIASKVRPAKILPENLIYPPFQTLYNYGESPYLGYVDIVSLEQIKGDQTFDKAVSAKVKGQTYQGLTDIDKQAVKDSDKESDDLMFAKIYCVWIKGSDSGPLKRCVLADQDGIDQPLVYEDWEGGGPDGTGYPLHLLALNDPCEGMLPPSEAWKLESILCVIDYLLAKMLRHLKKSKTRTLSKDLKKENVSKWIGAEDLELINISGLPPGVDIRSLIYQLEDQELSQDHDKLFGLAKRILDECSRKPAFAQVAIQEKKKTATETQAIQAQDLSVGTYKVDKFKDFLQGFFYDWAKLIQKNWRGTRDITVENGKTGQDEPREVIAGEDRNDLSGDFSVDINIESFVMQNKDQKRQTVKETLVELQAVEPLLKEQGKKLNAKRVVTELLENAHVRDPEGFLVDVPARTVDQQVIELAAKGVPMSIDELGSDYQGAMERLQAMFQDDEMMAKMEMMMPGISSGEGPLAMMMRDIEKMQELQKQKMEEMKNAA